MQDYINKEMDELFEKEEATYEDIRKAIERAYNKGKIEGYQEGRVEEAERLERVFGLQLRKKIKS